MTDFTASNGITVFVREGGTVQFQHGTRDELCGIIQVMPHSEWWQVLREFFQHERDEELSRWRWPEAPEYVVYSRRRPLFVLNELTGDTLRTSRGDGYADTGHGTIYNAAAAYFEAHPERKPWYDAKHNDLWELQISGCHSPEVYRFAQDTTCADSKAFRPVNNPKRVFFHVDSPLITAARRIWPVSDD